MHACAAVVWRMLQHLCQIWPPPLVFLRPTGGWIWPAMVSEQTWGEYPARLLTLGRRRWRASVITFLEASSNAQFVIGGCWGKFGDKSPFWVLLPTKLMSADVIPFLKASLMHSACSPCAIRRSRSLLCICVCFILLFASVSPALVDFAVVVAQLFTVATW